MLTDLILTVIAPTLIVVLVAILRGRRKKVSEGEFDSDSVGFAGGVVSALFTVMLAFYIVFAWQVGADIDGNTKSEAQAVVDAYWQADALPEPHRTAIRSGLGDYVSVVAGQEWPALVAGRTHPRPAELIQAIRTEFTAVPESSGAVAFAREQGLRDVRQLDENHRARVDSATHGDTLTTVLLVGTLVGAALMIVIPLLVGASTRPANVVILGILSAVVGATVFLAIGLSRPLDGPFGVGPDALVNAWQEVSPRP
ncbi:hypothetical protein ACQPWY_07300 [Pseudonocardia xinjiangensis]|uniref:bestrophin-like domain n=1 Tax=Pseudonocardia xinjiangensis TaxID=75289 RepID=UPI003D8AA801